MLLKEDTHLLIHHLPVLDRDYAENAERDQYDPDDIDDEEFERMDPAQRAQVEAMLARRDAEEARAAGRIPEAFMDGESSYQDFLFLLVSSAG